MAAGRAFVETDVWPAAADALAAGRAFLRAAAGGGRVAVTFHGDVDGLSGAVLVARALERLGTRDVVPVPAGKGEHPHDDAFRARLRALEPSAVVVLDMGSRAGPILPGVPTLLVDHHRPRGLPDGAVAVSAYGHEPIAPTGLLAFVLARAVAPLDDLAWLAALGTVADLGADAPFPALAPLLRCYGRTNVTEAIALMNAAKRSGEHDVTAAYDVLAAAGSPADVARGRVPGVDRLRAYRAEVNAEVARCARTAPAFAGRVALLRFASPAQVHPLVAIRWARRLRDAVVVAANDAYLPGRTNFSVRSAADVDLIAFLRGLDVGELGGDFAHGHDRATGGSLPHEDFARLLRALGFADAIATGRARLPADI